MPVNGVTSNSFVPHTKTHRPQEHNKNGFHEMLISKTPCHNTERSDSIAISGANAVAYHPTTQAKLAELREIDAKADYAGMTNTEIYKAIWDRYNAAFDGNMPAIRIGAYPGAATISLGGGQYEVGILEQFLGEVARNGSSYTVHSEAMGYEGMSYAEIEALILNKYEGKNTAIDFLNMTGELQLSGVLTNKLGDQTASFVRMVIDGSLSAGNPFRTELPFDEWSGRLGKKIDIASYLKGVFGNFSSQNPHIESLEPIESFVKELAEHYDQMNKSSYL